MTSFDISYFIITVLAQFVIIYLIREFFTKEIKFNFKTILIIIVSSIVESYISRILPSPVNGLICLVYFLLFIYINGKTKFKESFFYIVIIWLMLVIIDIFLMLILNIMTNMFNLQFEAVIIKPICTVCLCAILYILSKVELVKKLISKAYNNFVKLTYSFVQLLFIIVLYFLLGAIGITNLNNRIMILILLISAILFGLTIIRFIITRYEILTLKETNLLLIKNNEFYMKLIEDYRILKHNLISQLLGIKTVSNKKAKLLIDELIKDYNENFLPTQNIKNVPSGLNGLVYEKVYNFNKKDINVFVENDLKCDIYNSITSRNYNLLCEALGITLDNAMDAAYSSKDKVVYLKFNEFEDRIIVTIMNSFNGELDLELLGTIKYTTKRQGHGFGLYSLMERNKLQIQNKIRNNVFIVKIIIYKKNK